MSEITQTYKYAGITAAAVVAAAALLGAAGVVLGF